MTRLTSCRGFVLSLAILSLPAYVGCGPLYVEGEAGAVVVEEAPPPPRIEVIPNAPGPEYIWVPGRWAWRVGPRRYAWLPGHYRVIRHPHHHAWVSGSWQHGPRGWFWVRGHWR